MVARQASGLPKRTAPLGFRRKQTGFLLTKGRNCGECGFFAIVGICNFY
jgi:hypothetical protein